MNIQLIDDTSNIDKERWSDFVYAHPNGNIFQTPEMYEVYKSVKNYEPLFFAVINDKGDLIGIMLAAIQKEFSGVLGIVSSRSIIVGGPLVKDDNSVALATILSSYNTVIKRKAIYSQFRNMWDWGNIRQIFTQNDFKYEEHLNFLINLSKSEEELWNNLNSTRRNRIRRAQKAGTTVIQKNNINDLRESYAILETVYKRTKLPLPNISFFENILKYSDGKSIGLKLFCAEHDNKIIGCMFTLIYKNTIFGSYSGSYSEFLNKYPNDLIPWKIFLWGKANGYTLFDFGGAGKPDKFYGVREFKKKFGGDLVNFGRFEKIHKPLLMKLAKLGLKILYAIIK